MNKTIEVLCIAMLGFFVSSSIFYEIDGGLKASLYCAGHGETEECFNQLRVADRW